MATLFVRRSQFVPGFVAAALLAASACPAQEVIRGLDFWETSSGLTFVNFGGVSEPPIPANFFAPGSDPFIGQVCYHGDPLGPSTPFGTADTLIRRFPTTSGISPPPPGTATVPIEIVALSLVSCNPIVVTSNGGQNPQQWSVTVDLSATLPPAGQINIRKTHANGGTWDSLLPVQPKFTFTQVVNPLNVRVLDTGTSGIPPIILHVDPADIVPWSYTPPLGMAVPGCTSNFFPGVQPALAGPRQPVRWHSQTNDAVLTMRLASVCLIDMNHDGQITPVDIAIYVNTWFAALSNGC